VSARRGLRWRAIAGGLLLASVLPLVVPSGLGAERPPAGHGLAATRALVASLSRAGRGEASVTVTLTDPMGGPDVVQAGRLTLEPPGRVRLDFAATGERIALRGDAGEWIQPHAEQMVRLGREQAGMAAWLWEILMQGGTGGFSERATGTRRYALEPRDPDAGLPLVVSVELDARGLPVLIEIVDSADVTTRYRFKGWRFLRARGAAAFTLTAPRGYAVVEVP
jgi:outer membrane lipoprotein-sorting protein